MIQQLNIYEFTGFKHPLGNKFVIGAWCWIAAGVVVNKYDIGSVRLYGLFKYAGDIYRGAILGTNSNGARSHQPVLGV
jgi:hypothetical protein